MTPTSKVMPRHKKFVTVRSGMRLRSELRLRSSAPAVTSQKDRDDVSEIDALREDVDECSGKSVGDERIKDQIMETLFSSRELQQRGFEKGDTEERSNPFDSVPDEILLHLLSFLSPLQLVLSAAPSCDKLRELSRLPSLWRRLRFKGYASNESGDCLDEEALPTAVAAALIDRAAPHLRELEITERRDAAVLLALASYHPDHPDLTSIVLRRIQGPMPAVVLIRALWKFRNLRRLVLRDVRRHRSMSFFRQLGLRAPNLTVLDVGHCPQFGTAALAALAISGLSLKELRAYRKRGYRSTMPHATDEDFSLFCDRMKGTITVIKINASSLTDTSCNALIQCVHLQTLHLRNAPQLSGHGIINLATHLTKLVSLDLSGASLVPSQNWAEAFERMVAGPKMESLILCGCFGVDDFAVWFIGKNFCSLHRLVLANCILIGEYGCSAVISGCRNLSYLNIKGLGSSVVRSLSLLPSFIPQLKVLVFTTEENELLEQELLLKMENLQICKDDETKRLKFWRNVAINEELRKLSAPQDYSLIIEGEFNVEM